MSFTRSQLIELAHSRTERRGRDLNLDAEILFASQEICCSRKWWWRRKVVTFATEINKAEYDLSTTAINAGDFQQFQKKGVKLYDGTNCLGALDPEFDADAQDLAIVMEDKKTGKPSRLFMKPGNYLTMVLTPTPDAVYTVLGSYWAVPDTTPDAQNEKIPLLPPFMHFALLSRLEARINKVLLGESSQPYTVSMQEFAAQMDVAAMNEDFAEGRVRQSAPAGFNGDAIQSTS